ncbi:Hypp394 [Branchiostoma lanceolatum]|uniref:Hypp394 protein n=1 Tax=Branchiostoma lanceolatum TaxID=7740 RepID=A0A8J9YKP1_BRALA|nr:Hypp394 [Branchiostoma lanceolatum]
MLVALFLLVGLGTVANGIPIYLQDRPEDVFALPPEISSDDSVPHKVYIRDQPATAATRTACIMPGRICKQYPILCERLGLFSQRGCAPTFGRFVG